MHKRLMLLAVVGGLLGVAIGRVSFHIGGFHGQLILYLALIFAGPVYDLFTRRRVHPAYLVGLMPCLLLLTGMRRAIGSTEAWHRFVTWMTG